MNWKSFELEGHLFNIQCGSKLGFSMYIDVGFHFHHILEQISVNSPKCRTLNMKPKRRWEKTKMINFCTVSFLSELEFPFFNWLHWVGHVFEKILFCLRHVGISSNLHIGKIRWLCFFTWWNWLYISYKKQNKQKPKM